MRNGCGTAWSQPTWTGQPVANLATYRAPRIRCRTTASSWHCLAVLAKQNFGICAVAPWEKSAPGRRFLEYRTGRKVASMLISGTSLSRRGSRVGVPSTRILLGRRKSLIYSGPCHFCSRFCHSFYDAQGLPRGPCGARVSGFISTGFSTHTAAAPTPPASSAPSTPKR